MLSVRDIKRRLRDANLNKVAKNCGVNSQTLYRLMSGHDIRVSAIEKISSYLENEYIIISKKDSRTEEEIIEDEDTFNFIIGNK